MRVVSSFFIILLFSFSAAAIELIFPLDCDLGKDCWISNLPRHYLRDKQVDFRCGPNTYDGHKGTDFALKDYKQMEKGVKVQLLSCPSQGLHTGRPWTHLLSVFVHHL